MEDRDIHTRPNLSLVFELFSVFRSKVTLFARPNKKSLISRPGEVD